jgi:hypothetical protein
MTTQNFSIQILAGLIVRFGGLALICYSLSTLSRSLSFPQEQVTATDHVDYAGATLIVFGKSFVMSRTKARVVVVLLHLLFVIIGALITCKSRLLGQFLCMGLT